MYVLADNVNFYLGEGVEGALPNVTMLTAMFFFLNFLAATQVWQLVQIGFQNMPVSAM